MQVHCALLMTLMVDAVLHLISADKPTGVALLSAASKGRKGRLLEILKRRDLNVNYSEKSGWYRGYTALMWAAERNSTEIAEALLRAGANVNHRSYNNLTAVFIAAQYGYIELVRMFLGHGANPDVTTKQGFTALLYATWNRHLRVVEALLEQKANPNFQTPASKYFSLYLAARRGDRPIARALLQAGASPDMQTSWGVTALHTTGVWRRPAIARDLLRAGANINLQDHTGQSALHKASIYGFINLVRTFIGAGAHVDAQDGAGRTPLVWACRRGKIDVITVLLDAGADPNIPDNAGRSAVYWATRYGRNETATVLLKYCPELGHQESNETLCKAMTRERTSSNTATFSTSTPGSPPTEAETQATWTLSRTSPSAAVIRDPEYALRIPQDKFSTSEETIPLVVGPRVTSEAPLTTTPTQKETFHRTRLCGGLNSAESLTTHCLFVLSLVALWWTVLRR